MSTIELLTLLACMVTVGFCSTDRKDSSTNEFVANAQKDAPLVKSSSVDVLSGAVKDTARPENSIQRQESKVVCVSNDVACQQDQAGFDALWQLHASIDDDKDGSLDREESQEFIRDDLEKTAEGRSTLLGTAGGRHETDLHGSDDLLSVQDLWTMWSHSDIYRWTTEQVVDWLTDQVELSQYSGIFRAHAITGRMLPRLALNTQAFAQSIGIKNSVHRQKLALKATDLVLFGLPKSSHNYVKDCLLFGSLLVALCGGYYAHVQQKRSRAQLSKVMSDLNALQSAEDNLRSIQERLEVARQDQAKMDDDKFELEKKLREEIVEAKAEAERLKQEQQYTSDDRYMLSASADQELLQMREALEEAERQLESRASGTALTTLPDLQQWLQLTYETESKYFEAKRDLTDRQLRLAKEMCEKIRNQKGKFMSAFRMAHTSSIDDTDQKILSVRAALEDIKSDLQERMQRWRAIEQLCGFNIVINPGAPYLNSLLRESPSSSTLGYGDTSGGGSSQSRYIAGHASFATLDDDIPSHTQMSYVDGYHGGASGAVVGERSYLLSSAQSLSMGHSSHFSNGVHSAASTCGAGQASSLRLRPAGLVYAAARAPDSMSLTSMEELSSRGRVVFRVGDDASVCSLSNSASRSSMRNFDSPRTTSVRSPVTSGGASAAAALPLDSAADQSANSTPSDISRSEHTDEDSSSDCVSQSSLTMTLTPEGGKPEAKSSIRRNRSPFAKLLGKKKKDKLL